MLIFWTFLYSVLFITNSLGKPYKFLLMRKILFIVASYELLYLAVIRGYQNEIFINDFSRG